MSHARPYAARDLVLPVAGMAVVVAASNVLVQHPATVLGLEDYLTWGAFTYPVAFFVNDLTNRRFGADAARRVVVGGFLIAVFISVWLANPRIALASGAAFLISQLLDITVFSRLRRQAWWRAPLAASLFGSVVDTAIFFTLAFAGFLVPLLGHAEDFALAAVPFFGTALEAPRWAAWASADFLVKVAMALLMLVPYGALLRVVRPMETVAPRR
ncbi:membrane protein [Agaricicola taiwanensis]|uniref:Probable queuosine precursor transporter n=1 Tax=Agaricicola taiwanensis TaxID=591372 RepID=A0A8J2YLK1_9RHOB|nr:queuosine precursor transporter [Agaricicola taiwanensis]GGE52623.1 membrane protein [Agaricicola taiwanensis]